jgi:hypothetical protein
VFLCDNQPLTPAQTCFICFVLPFWGCSRLFPAVPGCFGAVPGCSRPVPGLFPAFFGLFRLSPCHSYNFMLLQEFLSALLNFSKFFKKFPQREVSSHTL